MAKKELTKKEAKKVAGGSFEDLWEGIKKMPDKAKKDVPNPQPTISPIK